jgi:hypothetical protein
MGVSVSVSISRQRKWLVYKPESNRSRRWWVLALFAGWTLYIAVSGIVGRLLISVDGRIVSSNTAEGIRPVTAYTIQAPHGESSYIAGPTDDSLPRRMPIGTYIRKNKYDLSYSKDGKIINDFPLGFHLLWLGISTICAWKSVSWWKASRIK